MDTIKKQVLEALELSLGVVTDACKAANCPRSTFYKWCSEDEEFKQTVDEIQNVALDFAESKLFKKIKDEDTTSIIFYLKTKGKARGFVERQELTGKDGSAIETDNKSKISIADLPDELARQIHAYRTKEALNYEGRPPHK